MTLFLKYSDPRGIEEPAVLTSIGSNIRFGELGLAMSAAVGEPDISSVEIDDPGGIWDFVGLRAFDVRETACASNNQMIGRFVIQDRNVMRSPERGLMTLGDRLWRVDLVDYNWHIGKRVLVDADAKRPAESAGDRIRWLLASAAHISLNDYGHVTYPSAQLDAHDYRGETAGTVLADCCFEDQYNFWVDYNEAHGRPELFFMNPDGTSYASDLSISNGPGEADQVTCFAPYMDATLTRSPQGVAFGVFLAYDGGYVYRRNATTGEQFAQVDRVAPMSTVHTAAKATRLANKFLEKNDEESDHITVGIKVPAANVNDIRHGHRIQVRFTHLPGYDDGNFHWMRVIRRQVIQDEEGGGQYYRLVLEMVPSGGTTGTGALGDYTGAAMASLIGIIDPPYASGYLTWDTDGAVAGGGWYPMPASGPLEIVQSSAPYWQIRVTGSQPIEVRIEAAARMSEAVSGTQSATLYVNVNGAAVGSDYQETTTPGLHFWSDEFYVDVHNVTLQPGDVVDVTIGATQNLFWTNQTNLTFLKVGRGTHIWNSNSITWVGP